MKTIINSQSGRKKSQTTEIKKYFKTHKSGLTSKEAFERFGATRLGGIVHTLRKSGMNIISEKKIVKTRYGRDVAVSCYKLMD